MFSKVQKMIIIYLSRDPNKFIVATNFKERNARKVLYENFIYFVWLFPPFKKPTLIKKVNIFVILI